jgi:hypothetical protein
MTLASISWMLRGEGLAPVVVSAIWLLVTAPLLRGCLSTPQQSAEATHRKCKTRRKSQHKKPPWDDDSSAKPRKLEQAAATAACYLITAQDKVLSTCSRAIHKAWHQLHTLVFGLRTQHTHHHSGWLARKNSSATYFICGLPSRGTRVGRTIPTRSACIGRKRNSSRHKWTRLSFLATTMAPVGSDPVSAFASRLSQLPSSQRRFAAFDTDSVTLRVDN